MSTQRGGDTRKRSQKHKNETAFKNNKYDSNSKAKKLAGLTIGNVCLKCKEIIEWKIKYNKYKPLTAPRKCVRCSEKTVKYAYHVACGNCVKKDNVCAKCLQAKEIVDVPELDESQRQKEEAQLRDGLKHMKLRERTTFLRQVERDRIAAESGCKIESEKTDRLAMKQKADAGQDDVDQSMSENESGDQDSDGDVINCES